MSIREDLQKVLDTYAAAYRVGDASACAAVFVPDGELYSPYAPPARGRAEIAALHKNWTQDGGEGKQLVIVDWGGSGKLSWCLASFSEGQITGDGTSLGVFERQSDGSWLIRICSLNSSIPQSATDPSSRV